MTMPNYKRRNETGSGKKESSRRRTQLAHPTANKHHRNIQTSKLLGTTMANCQMIITILRSKEDISR